MELTQERLKELLSYDPLTGVFCWRGGQKKTVAGAIAGGPDKDGYVLIKVDQKMYKAHRLAWLWMTGVWPSHEIDHVDLDKANNRFGNLREATKSQNMHNTKCRSDNSTGFKGVQYDPHRNRFYAKIITAGQKTWLGYHRTAESASAAYQAAAIEQHKDFARIV